MPKMSTMSKILVIGQSADSVPVVSIQEELLTDTLHHIILQLTSCKLSSSRNVLWKTTDLSTIMYSLQQVVELFGNLHDIGTYILQLTGRYPPAYRK